MVTIIFIVAIVIIIIALAVGSAKKENRPINSVKTPYVSSERVSILKTEKPKVYFNPSGSIKFEVAGTHYLNNEEKKLLENVREYEQIELISEPNNSYNEKAISVRTTNGVKLGYVPEEALEEVQNNISSGENFKCEIRKISEGRTPYYWVLLAPIKKRISINTDATYTLDIEDPPSFIIEENREMKNSQLKRYFDTKNVVDLYKELSKEDEFDELENLSPIKLISLNYDYLMDNLFSVNVDFEFEDKSSVSLGLNYHLDVLADLLFEEGRKAEKEGNTERAINEYIKILQSKDIYRKVFYDAVLRLSILFGKLKDYESDCKILTYAIGRLQGNYKGFDYIESLKERLGKSLKKLASSFFIQKKSVCL